MIDDPADTDPATPALTSPPADPAAPGETQSGAARPPADGATPLPADIPPDRLAIHPASPHYRPELLRRGIGIRFKGVVRTNVEEYCISEGWVRVQAGKTMDRKGNPLTLKLAGPVEAWFEDLGADAPLAKA